MCRRGDGGFDSDVVLVGEDHINKHIPWNPGQIRYFADRVVILAVGEDPTVKVVYIDVTIRGGSRAWEFTSRPHAVGAMMVDAMNANTMPRPIIFLILYSP